MTLLWHRRFLIFASVAIIGGSITASIGYAYYLHGTSYRNSKTQELARATGLDASIGSVQPLSFRSRKFDNIRLCIPEDQTEIFHCRRAIWRENAATPSAGSTLEIEDGWMLLGTHQWGLSQYEKVLQSGLGHDFASLGLRQVRFSDLDLEWLHQRFRLTFGGAAGEVDFESGRRARAKISACILNNETLSDPVYVTAQLTTGSPPTFHEVVLTVPRLPLASLGLEQVLETEIQHGQFAGRIIIREKGTTLSVEAAGQLEDAHLPELTNSIIGGPFSGRADIAVDQFLFSEDTLSSLRFHGRLSGLKLGELAPFLQMAETPGQIDLRVHQADLSADRIHYLSAGGKATEVSLEALTRQLGYGLITGRLRLDIREMTIVDDSIISADVELHAEPPTGGTGTIDQTLVAYVSKEWLGMDLSAVLPEKIPYTKLGVRLILNQGRLYLRGTHGQDEQTMLTVKVFNREWAVLNQPDRSFEVPDLLAMLRAQALQQSPADLRQWWEEQHRDKS